MTISQSTLAWLVLAFFCAGRLPVYAQAAQSQAPQQEPLGWSNTTDLSLVLTEGNSSASTLGFSNKLRHVWSDARSEFEVTTVRAHTSDDRFFLVNPGIEFPVGGAPSNPATTIVTPDPTSTWPTISCEARTKKHFTPPVLEYGRELVPQRRCRHSEPVHRVCGRW